LEANPDILFLCLQESMPQNKNGLHRDSHKVAIKKWWMSVRRKSLASCLSIMCCCLLSDKFRNFRKRCRDPSVMANKRGPNNERRERHASNHGFPVRPDGEDDHTQLEHRDWLSTERRKAYPNREGVKR
jgi:hypothetical protein